mmetsp:Transcript_1551/g.1838  ORF Transcript_1551/g.1838 Transcript_1551/m.1838 type:complete len:621 (+) Transcript_1551:482-2344(+)
MQQQYESGQSQFLGKTYSLDESTTSMQPSLSATFVSEDDCNTLSDNSSSSKEGESSIEACNRKQQDHREQKRLDTVRRLPRGASFLEATAQNFSAMFCNPCIKPTKHLDDETLAARTSASFTEHYECLDKSRDDKHDDDSKLYILCGGDLLAQTETSFYCGSSSQVFSALEALAQKLDSDVQNMLSSCASQSCPEHDLWHEQNISHQLRTCLVATSTGGPTWKEPKFENPKPCNRIAAVGHNDRLKHMRNLRHELRQQQCEQNDSSRKPRHRLGMAKHGLHSDARVTSLHDDQLRVSVSWDDILSRKMMNSSSRSPTSFPPTSFSERQVEASAHELGNLCIDPIFSAEDHNVRVLDDIDLCYDSDPGDGRSFDLYHSEETDFWTANESHITNDSLSKRDDSKDIISPMVNESLRGASIEEMMRKESMIAEHVKETIHNTFTLTWHPPAESNNQTPENFNRGKRRRTNNPVCVKAWIEMGNQLKNDIIEPKFMWRDAYHPDLDQRKLNETSKAPYGVNLMQICRVINSKGLIDRNVHPFAKESCSFLVCANHIEPCLFEASSPEEKDRIVHSLKVVVSRLVCKAIARDAESLVSEFFTPQSYDQYAACVPGDEPDLSLKRS